MGSRGFSAATCGWARSSLSTCERPADRAQAASARLTSPGMCGIAGIYAYHYAANPVDPAELRTIRDHMSARGPDGVGEWCSLDRRVGLGNRRLAIVDLSERGNQPMSSADGSVVVTFNGEIYNFRTLRSELEARGYAFRTQTDTEILLHLYADRGAAM